MTLEQSEESELESAIPRAPQKRDALGQFCFVIHFLPLIFVIVGWLAPWRGALLFYLLFLPGMFLQWRLNRDSCIFNNIESLIRTGKWRNRSNREEGAWLRTLVNDKTGWKLSRRQIDTSINAALVTFWSLGFSRLMEWI
jgi:hypothetical protein